jgi:hypothetical protein
VADVARAYRAWMWRRLAILVPAGVAALAWGTFFASARHFTLAVRIPCLSIAGIFAILQGYLILRTVNVVRYRGVLPLQVARTRRREMRPAGLVSLLSLAVLAGLLEVASLPPASPPLFDPGPVARRKSRERAEPEIGGKEEVTIPATPPAPAEASAQVEKTSEQSAAATAPKTSETPAIPAPVADARPEIRPELVLEPAHLSLEEMDPAAGQTALVPDPPAAPVAQVFPDPTDESSPFRVDRERFAEFPARSSWWLGIQSRPLPDENDPESWLRPEGRVDGFLLLGGGDRVPGLTLALDLPFGRYDFLAISWSAADLPRASDADHGVSADWHHATLAYVRHLAGYTSHASTDVAVSLGVSMDLFGEVVGIPDPGGTPKFSPYLGLDLGFWQKEPIGLLIHLGESIPATLFGSSLGMTDFSAQIRWDLTERISIHGGYRVLWLRYKTDEVAVAPNTDPLHDSLSGPMLGIDIRF